MYGLFGQFEMCHDLYLLISICLAMHGIIEWRLSINKCHDL